MDVGGERRRPRATRLPRPDRVARAVPQPVDALRAHPPLARRAVPDDAPRLDAFAVTGRERRRRAIRTNVSQSLLERGRDRARPGVDQLVAGHEAVIIKATDAEKLRQWLEKHGYDARPALTAWLEPYVKAGWIITAFQIAKKEQRIDDVETKAVRMSFTAERPFFPYSEPPDQREGNNVYYGRFLRVFCIANQRMQGEVDGPNKEWSGRAAWAGQLEDERKQELGQHLGQGVTLPEGAWLTVFDDPAAPRPGTADVFFSPAADQSELRRPVIYDYRVIYYPATDLSVALVVVCLGGFLVWFVRRRVSR